MNDHDGPAQSIDAPGAVNSSADGDEYAEVDVCLDDDLLRSLNKMASRLCSTCLNFPQGEIQRFRDDSDYRVYHPSLSSLQESVDAGCCICKDLSQALDKLCKQFQPPKASTEMWSIRCKLLAHRYWRGNVNSPDAFALEFYLWESDCDYAVRNFHETSEFATMKFFPAGFPGLGPEFLDPSLETSTAKSKTSMNMARDWYHQCLSHTTCRNWRQDCRCLPTRLVRIWRPDTHSPDFISAELCDTSYLPLSTAYTTLSHLWGDNQLYQLQRSNIEELMQSIPIHQLPQLFRDAMYVSIELGIEYIWIDSLCIIQDSKTDWIYEAKRMGDVYQYAACNIAAAGYQKSSLGLFSERKALSRVHPPLLANCVVKIRNRGTHGPFKGLYVRADEAAFFLAISRSILNSRAWVAQERALSPCIIHFTPEMMWWECNHLVANETFPAGSIKRGDEDRFKICTIRSLTAKSDPEDIYAFWRKFVSLYAGKELTYEQDRFPAAIGIARTLGELIDDNLVAGFWEGDLVRSLIMRRRGRIENIPATWRAPSWSWASLRAGYDTHSKASQALPLSGVSVRVLSDVPGFKSDLDSTSLETSDVRGLEITAPLRKLTFTIKTGPDEPFSNGVHMSVEHDISKGSSAVDIPEDQAWRLRDPTHVLALAKGHLYEDDRLPWPIVYALLVQQVCEAKGHNTFRKVGVVYFYFLTEEKLEEYFRLQKENEEHNVPSLVFEECGFQEIVLI